MKLWLIVVAIKLSSTLKKEADMEFFYADIFIQKIMLMAIISACI